MGRHWKNFPDFAKVLTGRQSQISNLQGLNSQGNLSADTPIVIKSHFYLSTDSVGQAKILAGSSSVRVIFSKPYEQQPIVTVTPNSRVGGEYWVADKDASGFTIFIDGTNGTNTTNGSNIPVDITFDWHAFASGEDDRIKANA